MRPRHRRRPGEPSASSPHLGLPFPLGRHRQAGIGRLGENQVQLRIPDLPTVAVETQEAEAAFADVGKGVAPAFPAEQPPQSMTAEEGAAPARPARQPNRPPAHRGVEQVAQGIGRRKLGHLRTDREQNVVRKGAPCRLRRRRGSAVASATYSDWGDWAVGAWRPAALQPLIPRRSPPAVRAPPRRAPRRRRRSAAPRGRSPGRSCAGRGRDRGSGRAPAEGHGCRAAAGRGAR